ncbi:purple acid phosphatase family protein [Aureivirga sp. CE67]|uniref:purple acid phosphatase family protein n=1 Tax=Aureivirga sp. CE67 TaxID=1788983 RepID=UPI0018C90201|nr:metallophosphoesterase family protein [Aureivirga sp. CE67]
MIKKLSIAILLFISFAFYKIEYSEKKKSLKLEREPYLQTVFADSATISWKTNIISKVSLKYGESKLEMKSVDGKVVDKHVNILNEVVLKGLKPNTKYFYEIYNNDSLMAGGDSYYFISSVKAKSKEKFSFYAMGDIGQPKAKGGFPDITANQINKLETRPDFGIGLGDIVYPIGESKKYDAYFYEPMAPILRNIPFYPALGNHDWYSDPDENFKREWKLPNNEHYYTFSYGNSFFIALDSREGGFYKFRKQKAWLEKTLKENQGKYDWIFVYLHHNGKTCSYKKDYKHVMKLYDVFAENNIDFVLNGHAHTYERLRPYDKNGNILTKYSDDEKYPEIENGFISITAGAGGKLKTPWTPDPSNQKNCKDGDIVSKFYHKGHFTTFEIVGKKLVFKGIDSETGEVFDTFTMEK